MSALEELTPLPNALPITCSIGAAVFSYGEGDYHTFFQCADQALYIRKKSGRKGVTFYQAVKECSSDHLMSAVNEESNIDQVEIMEEQLAQYAFRKLYAAKDIHLTIERLLGIIGHAYDVSRVYIFESNDGHSCFNTFEWCAKGIKPMNSSISVSLAETAQRFDEQGLFYCAEVKPMSKHTTVTWPPRIAAPCFNARYWMRGSLRAMSVLTNAVSIVFGNLNRLLRLN